MIEFFTPGKPAPQGSKRHVGRGIMVESSRDVGAWRERIAIAAHNTMRSTGWGIVSGPVTVTLGFILPRPKNAPKVTPAAMKRPDLDKLVRAVLDAVTGVVIADDSQVVALHATKIVAAVDDSPGVHTRIEETSC